MSTKTSWRLLGIAAVALIVVIGPGLLREASAGHAACGAVLGPGGSHVLDSNVGPCPGTALTLIGPVTLDMRGRTVSCGGGSIGIDISGRGVQLRNGTVRDCAIGVFVFGTLLLGDRNVLTRNDTEFGETGYDVQGLLNILSINHADGHATAYHLRPGAHRTVVRSNAVGTTAPAPGFSSSRT